jgi:hypothetical protein
MLLAPHKGKLLPIEGIVANVFAKQEYIQVVLSNVDGNENVSGTSFVDRDKDAPRDYDRAAALQRGAHVRVLGKVTNVDSFYITLDACEFAD